MSRSGRIPEFPAALWLLALANFILFAGRGMAIPFLVIFFGQVVGLGEGLVGAGIAAQAIVGVLFTLLMAGAIDRFGARQTLIVTILGIAATNALYPVATSAPLFFTIMIIQGMAIQMYWPSSDTLAASLVSLHRAGEMFALIRVANALGTGAGGLIGGLLVAGGGFPQYRTLFLLSAGLVSLAGAIVALLVRSPDRPAGAAVEASRAGGDWREVLADRRFLFSQIVMFILLSGFTQLQVSVPPFLRGAAGVNEAWIGLLFTINTVIMVAAQLWVARTIAPWSRGLTLALAALCWSIAYLLMAGSLWIVSLPLLGIVVFTVGQMLFLPTSGVIIVEQAPDRLRGRYLAFGSSVWGLSYGLASWGAGIVLASERPVLLFPGLVALLGLGAIGGLLFDRMQARAVQPPAASSLLD